LIGAWNQADGQELFTRFERLGGNNIPALERRIEATNQKIGQMVKRPDVRQTEIARLQGSVVKDKESIERQRNRDWLIKECMTEEILLAQNTQYQISKYDDFHSTVQYDNSTNTQNATGVVAGQREIC
jgi:hypothetical protein